MQPCVDAEAEHGAVEPTLKQRTDEALRRSLRVEIDRSAERFCRCEDRPVFRIVGVFAVDVSVQDHRLESQCLAALDLLCRPGGILRRDRGHADEAVGVASAGVGQLIVGIGGQSPGFIHSKHVGARGRERDDGLVDAGRVHVGEAARPQVL